MKLTFTDILRAEISRMQTLHPDRVGELSRAHAAIIEGHVIDNGDGTGRVKSRNTSVWYTTNSHCECPAAAFDKPCRHLQAWKLYQHIAKKYAEVCAAPPLPWEEGPSDPGPLTPVPPPTTVAQALPEAAASINVRLIIDGRDCQLTLRGIDEDAVLTRLEAVLARYPVPQASAATSPAPVPETAAVPLVALDGWCHFHNVQMTWYPGKDGKPGWYSHLVSRDNFCKGKAPKGGAA